MLLSELFCDVDLGEKALCVTVQCMRIPKNGVYLNMRLANRAKNLNA